MSDQPTASKLPPIDFGAAISKIISPQQQLAAAELIAGIRDGGIDRLIKAFEDAAHADIYGNEYWDARDLQKLLEYADYRNFLNIVEKAKESCKTTGIPVSEHFVDVTDMIDIGNNASRPIETIKLTRYACYLIAQNGDPKKRAVAFAQTYFAVQTRRQETQDEVAAQTRGMSEDEKRILLRDEIKEHNKALASAARQAGVVKPIDYAIFQNSGYQGLYGGLGKAGIARQKGLKAKDNILDHMGSTELAANLFRATQTEEKLIRDNVKGKTAANDTHFAVGKKVREAIREIGGTMPEHLPRAENLVQVAKRIKKAIETGEEKTG